MQERQEPSLFPAITSSKDDFNVDFSKELEQERKLNPNYKPQIRYNKKPFSTLIFPNFTSFDFNLFMCFCFAANEKGNLKIKLNFNDLNFLMGKFDEKEKIEKNSKRLFNKFNEFIEKATKTIIKIVETDGKYSTITYTGFFDFIKIYEKEKIIIIQFNESIISALNNFKFSNFYTQFELQEYCKLKSKYSKQLYILLMNDLYQANKGKPINKNRDELIKCLNLNSDMYNREFDFEKRVLAVAKGDFEKTKLFTDFKIEKVYKDNKLNGKVVGYNFIYKK